MPAPIEFFFDFSSPYSYLAATRIEALAARYQRTVAFKPTLLGAVFKVSRGAPLTELYEGKARYSLHDFERSARFADVPYQHPNPFPVATVGAARAVLWLQARHPAQASPFIQRTFRAYFADGRNVGEPAVVAQIAGEMGVDAAALAAGTQEPAIKEQLKSLVDEAIARGVFGAPFMFVDGEPFWGNDRLPQVERWLERGPF